MNHGHLPDCMPKCGVGTRDVLCEGLFLANSWYECRAHFYLLVMVYALPRSLASVEEVSSKKFDAHCETVDKDTRVGIVARKILQDDF